MARPRSNDNERRDERVTANYTVAEKGRLRLKAIHAGLTISEYVRIQSLEGKIITGARHKTDPALIAEWNRIGVNLNQIAYKANATGRFDAAEIEATLMQIETLLFKSTEGAPDGPESGRQRREL